MANIIPFRGTLYNTQKIKDISKVTAPPYDVISDEERDKLYNSDPHNIIRMLLGKDSPGDNEKNNKYTRAAGFLKEWQEKGVLRKDEKESIYLYSQEFKIDGKINHRLGFIALLKLEAFDTKKSSVHPHENTLLAPKEDRTKLIKAIEANLGPVFAIFEDKNKAIAKIIKKVIKTQPLINISDSQGIRNKLWRISDKMLIKNIIDLLKKKEIFIADGHHRYEVGLEFSKFKKGPKYGYILTYFTDLYEKGLVILPVHRLVGGINDEELYKLENDLRKDFIVKKLLSKNSAGSFLDAAGPSEARFVIYKKKSFMGLMLKNKKTLDVTIAKDLIIEPLREKLSLDNRNILIDFTKDLDYAVKEVDNGDFSFTILLNPIKVTQIRDTAFLGKRMPQKSTYFYPKVLTGLVINVF